MNSDIKKVLGIVDNIISKYSCLGEHFYVKYEKGKIFIFMKDLSFEYFYADHEYLSEIEEQVIDCIVKLRKRFEDAKTK